MDVNVDQYVGMPTADQPARSRSSFVRRLYFTGGSPQRFLNARVNAASES